MKKYLFLTLFLLVTFSSAFCQEKNLYIEIIPSKETLDKGEIFTITTRIMNVDSNEQKVCFWTCSYDENWRLQGDYLPIQFYGQTCDKNVVTCKILKPFEAFEKELYFQVLDDAKSGMANFKLEFLPCSNREECFAGAGSNQKKMWSMPARIKIK